MNRTSIIGSIAAMAAAVAGPAHAQPAAPAIPAVPAAQAAPAGAGGGAGTRDDGYVLGPGDVIEVGVLGREDYHPRVRVQTDGAVQLPLIGRTVAQGRTALQLADDVRQALRSGGFFTRPTVSVDIATYSSRYVTVLGEVASPGLVPIDRAYRLSEVIARVGGLKDSGADVLTVRRAGGAEERYSILALATGGPDKDPLIGPGDKMFVPQAATFYIYGQVASPGNFKLDQAMSVRQAVARSGGLTPSGSEKRIRIFRDGKDIGKVDLNAPIRAGDVLVVGERFF